MGRPAPRDLARHAAEERLERGLTLLAYIIERDREADGLAYVPLFDRLEAELLTLRRRGDPLARVGRFLDAHTVDVTLKAIR